MSQALVEQAAGERHGARSAGTTPGDRVHSEVLEVMAELGIDLSGRAPQKLTPELAESAASALGISLTPTTAYDSANG